MGMYDWVRVNCPKCGEPYDFQSKSGECLMSRYDLQTCPANVLEDVNRHAPANCEKCNTSFYVDKVSRKAAIVGWNPTANKDAQEESVLALQHVIDDVLFCKEASLPPWLRNKLVKVQAKALGVFSNLGGTQKDSDASVKASGAEKSTFPENLDLINNVTKASHRMRFKDALDLEAEISGDKDHVTWTISSHVCDAVAFAGLSVRLIGGRKASRLSGFVSVSVDGEKIVSKAPIKSCMPMEGGSFLELSCVFDARLLDGRRVGSFLANGTVVKVWFSDLKKAAGKNLKVTLCTAMYTTKRD